MEDPVWPGLFLMNMPLCGFILFFETNSLQECDCGIITLKKKRG